MRKIFISLLLVLNFSVSWKKNGCDIFSGHAVSAQSAQQVATYLNSLNNGYTYTYNSSVNMVFMHDGSGGWPSVVQLSSVSVPNTWSGPATGSGFTAWVGMLSSATSSAINDFLSMMGGGGGSGESGGEEWEPGGGGWEPNPDGFGYDPTDPNSVDNLMNDPNFNPSLSMLDSWSQDVFNNLDMYEDLYTGNFTVDCAGQVNGPGYVGACGFCSAITSCPDSTLPRTDTAQPVKIICDSLANDRGNRLTTIQNSVAALPAMQRLKDSAYLSSKESGLNITKDSPAANYGVINFSTGAGNNVTVPTSDPVHTIVAGHHTHPKGTANSPSPADLYHLLEGYTGNHNYMADFITAADSSQFALMITDTANVANFLASYPQDSVIAGPPVNDWDTVRNGINKPIADRYKVIMNYLFNVEKYPLEYVQAYANAYMLIETFNYSCVRMYKKVNGQFKELNVQKQFDAAGTIIGIKITICQ